jgi:hypothetical protein
MVKTDDWRLMGQEKYLLGKQLMHKQWRQSRENWAHDHCVFCTDTFSDDQKDKHIGYCTLDEYYWICEDCFNDFSELFQWRSVVSTNEEASGADHSVNL